MVIGGPHYSPAEALAERVGARLTRRTTPHEWRARCPAHKGTSDTSLKITEGNDGRALVQCKSGCETEAVLAAVGASWSDLFADGQREPTPKPAGVTVGGKTAGKDKAPFPWARREYFGRVVATYPYHDADDVEQLRVTRHETSQGKTIRPWHQDASGDWVLGKGEDSSLPYRLPAMLAADPTEAVFVGEGEKVVDRLRAAGLVATTNDGGAGKWSPKLSTWLQGRDVVILPDNDGPGRTHAETVAEALRGIAASVKVVELAGLPEKGDAFDWLEAGGTAAELRRLAEVAPEWEPTEAASAPAGPALIITSMDAVTPKAIDWLWDRWLARGKLHILGGHAGDGKSTLLAALAAAYSRRGTLPDGTVMPVTRWLFLLAEDALDDTFRPRLDAHSADPSQVFAIEAVREASGADRLFNITDHLPLLEAEIARHEISVVVIDPVTSFMPRSDRNAEGDVRDLLTPLGKLAERTGVAIIAVMHVGKPNGTGRRPLQQLLGATAFGAIARIVWMVAPTPDDEGDGRRVLGVVKSNLSMKPETLEWSRPLDGPITWHGVSEHRIDDLLGGQTAQPRDDAQGFLQEALAGGSKPATEVLNLAKAAGISERTLRRAADALAVVRFKTPGVKTGPWLWKLPDGPSQVHDARSEPSHEEKMATLEDGQVDTFTSSDGSWKTATDPACGHLPRDAGRREDGHMDMLKGGHLLPTVDEQHDPVFTATITNLLALTPDELAAYRRELAEAPPNDPDLEHDRAALAHAEAILAVQQGAA